jgi:hypothetical protein
MENVQWVGQVTKMGEDRDCIQKFGGKNLMEAYLEGLER